MCHSLTTAVMIQFGGNYGENAEKVSLVVCARPMSVTRHRPLYGGWQTPMQTTEAKMTGKD